MSLRLLLGFVLASLAGCSFGTRGSLHPVPSTAAELPFASDGVYVVDGHPTSCERPPTGAVFDPAVRCTICRFMAFEDDGTFIVAESEEALRNATTDQDPYGLAVRRGNFRVANGRVDARALGPGGDSGSSRIVSAFDLAPTGPESFAYDQTFTADGTTACARHKYVLQR